MRDDSTACVFCELMKSGAATWVAKEESAVAFFPLPETALAPGHTLVVPREHCVGVLDASAAALAATMSLVQRVSLAMTKALGATGVVLLNASGPFSGQSVDHLHFHVVPCWPDDAAVFWPEDRSAHAPIPDAGDLLAAALLRLPGDEEASVTDRACTLVVLSGLPGTGKTTLARAVADRVDAVHVRIDTIEAALVSSGLVAAAGGWDAAPDAGYRVAYAIARDLLRAGHDVVADSVNPLAVTRRAWTDVAAETASRLLDVEVVCSDPTVHRRRVHDRTSDLAGMTVPTWEQVEARHYERWDRPVLRVDTTHGVDAAVVAVVDHLRALR